MTTAMTNVDVYLTGPLPLPDDAPPISVAQNETHWVGIIRLQGKCSPEDLGFGEVLAAIPTGGENTHKAFLAELDKTPERMAAFKSIHPDYEKPIVVWAGESGA